VEPADSDGDISMTDTTDGAPTTYESHVNDGINDALPTLEERSEDEICFGAVSLIGFNPVHFTDVVLIEVVAV
jgi:hypothetical protein